MAAAIAYRLLFSLIPALALIVAGAGWLLRVPGIEQRFTAGVLALVPIDSGLVMDAIRRITASSGSLTLLGVVALLWAASGLFGAVRDGLDAAWGVKRGRGLVHAKLLDVASIAGVWILIGLSIAITGALQAVFRVTSQWSGAGASLEPLWKAAGWIVPAANSFVAFLLVYRYVPNVSHGWRDVWVGALAATTLFELAKHGFAVYASHFSRYEMVYGALGTVMLFMFWVFVSANILLAGGGLSATLERRHSS